MLSSLDHAVVGVRDLEQAEAAYTRLLGRGPWWRGTHPGAGTANLLYDLAGVGIELLAPQGQGPVGQALTAALESRGEGLVALAFGTGDAEACAEALRARGVEAGAPRPGQGADAEGVTRHWQTVEIPLATTRGLLLFAIERGAGPGPPGSAAQPDQLGALDHVVVTTPDLEAARTLYADLLGLRLALERRFEARGLHILFFRVGGVTVEVVGRLGAAAQDSASDAFGGLAYRVADADAARARLAAAGLDVSPVRDGAKPGTRVLTVRDGTCGVPTLLVEPGP